MKIKYDHESDAMYIKVRKEKFGHNKKVGDDVILDCDKKGNILGIELLFVTENNPTLLESIKMESIAVI